jgi:phage shock protein C
MAETRLARDLDEAMLGGVLAGLAARYEWNVTLVRIVAVVVTMTTLRVPGVMAYLAAWVIVPPSSEVKSGSAVGAVDFSSGASEGVPHTPPGVVDEIVATVRDAADRIEEAGRIAGGAARQVATEIGQMVQRPREDEGAHAPKDAGTEQASTTGDKGVGTAK